MYQIKLSKSASKQLDKLDQRYHSALVKSFDRLSQDPYCGARLVGKLKGLWKLRFSRYRIIYSILEKKVVIYVLDVRHRKDVYRL